MRRRKYRQYCLFLFGSQTDTSVANLFSEPHSVIPELSDKVSVASLDIAMRILKDNRIPIDEKKMSSYTVKGVVGEMLKQLGCEAWQNKLL